MRVVHTNGKDKDFIHLCIELDKNLDELVGGAFQRKEYNQYNQLDDIHDVVILYNHDTPAACGSFKHFDDKAAEIKRVFVHPDFRRQGLAVQLMSELETKALKKGYTRLILETGDPLVAATSLYTSIGFRVIENYGPYVNMPSSICMEKQLG